MIAAGNVSFLIALLVAFSASTGAVVGDESETAPTTGLSEEIVIFLAPNGPVFMRVRTVVDDNDFRTWLGEFLFDALDTDSDQSLQREEWVRLPQGIVVADGFPSVDQLLKECDVDPTDERLSREEFVPFVRSRMPNSFDITAPPQRRTLVVQLLQKLDVDADGRLSPEELTDGAQTLSKRDFDDDGTFSATELLPFRDPRFETGDPDTAAPQSRSNPSIED